MARTAKKPRAKQPKQPKRVEKEYTPNEFERLTQAVLERARGARSKAHEARDALCAAMEGLAHESAAIVEALSAVSRLLGDVCDQSFELEGCADELAATQPLDGEELLQAAAYIEALADPCKRHSWSHLSPDRSLLRVSDALHAALELAQ